MCTYFMTMSQYCIAPSCDCLYPNSFAVVPLSADFVSVKKTYSTAHSPSDKQGEQHKVHSLTIRLWLLHKEDYLRIFFFSVAGPYLLRCRT